MTAPVTITHTTHGEVSSLAAAAFYTAADGWTEAASQWVDSDTDLDDIDAAAAEVGFESVFRVAESESIWKSPDGTAAVACVDTWDGFRVQVVGSTRQSAASTLAAFAALIPTRSHIDSATVPVSFWTFDPMVGGTRYVRDLDRLGWDAVSANYPSVINDRLADMCRWDDAPDLGRLVVFHGPPGTGKSRFVQTLASEWAGWADVHYIVDPDMMFREANYMTRVMLGGGGDDRWRLVVVEDGDEFIDRSAKDRSGYGVSRLLNIADGLVGQGLKVMVLVSTNVRGARFTPAMVRPGRCAALIEFPPFPVDEAAVWCAARAVTPPDRPSTLADLYATAAGMDPTQLGDNDDGEMIG